MIVLCLCVIIYSMQTPTVTEFCLYTTGGRNIAHFYFNIHSSSFPQGVFISDGSFISEPTSCLRKSVHFGER